MSELANMNLGKLIQHYSEDSNCRELLETLRWPDGVRCPRCDHDAVYEITKRNQYQCKACDYRFSVTAGTIFDNTNLPLWKWFVTIYMMLESKKGVSAAQIARTIDVSYPTAWHLCHRIREALDEHDDDDGPPSLLRGIVEIDETWVGGKQVGVGRGNTEDNTMVAGALERDGNVRMDVVDSRTRKDQHAFVARTSPTTPKRSSRTRGRPTKGSVTPTRGTRASITAQRSGSGVKSVHTNGVECLWSLLQRALIGAYHKVNSKYLERYLDELAWHFNNRENEHMFRDTLARLLGHEPLRYTRLTA